MAKSKAKKTSRTKKSARNSGRKPVVTAQVKGKTVNIFVTKVGLKQGIRAAVHSAEE